MGYWLCLVVILIGIFMSRAFINGFLVFQKKMAGIGDPHGTYINHVCEPAPLHSVVGRNHSAEMSYVKPIGPHGTLDDPEYWLNTSEGLFVKFSDLGLVNRIERVKGDKRELVLRRDHYDYFGCEGKKLSYGTVVNEIDSVYDRIRTLGFSDQEERRLFDWDAQRMIARFDDYRMIVHSDSDIIAKKSDRMVIVKISDKCDRHCIYCTEPAAGGIRLYSMDHIDHNMRMLRALQHKYHHGFEHLFTEGFLNTADINYFFLKGYTHPARIAEQMYKRFPELQKLYTFMGVPTTLEALERDPRYLSRLRDAGINRILLGFETGDTITSRFLGKNETNRQKKEAAWAILDHGFKLSIILQWGMVGLGFFHKGEGGKFVFRPIERIVRNTKTLIADTLEGKVASGTKTRPQVILSRYVPAEGTRLAEIFASTCIDYPTVKGSEWEKRSYLRFCEKHGIDIEDGYECALEGRVRKD